MKQKIPNEFDSRFAEFVRTHSIIWDMSEDIEMLEAVYAYMGGLDEQD